LDGWHAHGDHRAIDAMRLGALAGGRDERMRIEILSLVHPLVSRARVIAPSTVDLRLTCSRGEN
jgi:hypothetical protein